MLSCTYVGRREKAPFALLSCDREKNGWRCGGVVGGRRLGGGRRCELEALAEAWADAAESGCRMDEPVLAMPFSLSMRRVRAATVGLSIRSRRERSSSSVHAEMMNWQRSAPGLQMASTSAASSECRRDGRKSERCWWGGQRERMALKRREGSGCSKKKIFWRAERTELSFP